jgi:hypothetical protein
MGVIFDVDAAAENTPPLNQIRDQRFAKSYKDCTIMLAH